MISPDTFLLALVTGLSTWTLSSVVRLRETMARIEQTIVLLPCQKGGFKAGTCNFGQRSTENDAPGSLRSDFSEAPAT